MDSNIVSLSLLPEGVFNSFKALDMFTKEYAKSAGYTIIIRKSERRKGRILRYINYKRASTERSSTLEDDRQYRQQTIKT
jgi:hypothetical protein